VYWNEDAKHRNANLKEKGRIVVVEKREKKKKEWEQIMPV